MKTVVVMPDYPRGPIRTSDPEAETREDLAQVARVGVERAELAPEDVRVVLREIELARLVAGEQGRRPLASFASCGNVAFNQVQACGRARRQTMGRRGCIAKGLLPPSHRVES